MKYMKFNHKYVFLKNISADCDVIASNSRFLLTDVFVYTLVTRPKE